MVNFTSVINGATQAGMASGLTHLIRSGQVLPYIEKYISPENLLFSPSYSAIGSVFHRIYFEGIKYATSMDQESRWKNVIAHVVSAGCATITLLYTQQHFISTWDLSPLSPEQAVTAAAIALLAQTVLFIAKSIFKRINFVAVLSGTADAGVASGLTYMSQNKEALFYIGKYIPTRYFLFSSSYAAIASIFNRVYFEGIKYITSMDNENRWKNAMAQVISAGCGTLTLIYTQAYLASSLNLSPLSTEQAITATALAILAEKIFAFVKFKLKSERERFREEINILQEEENKLSQEMKILEDEIAPLDQVAEKKIEELKQNLEVLFSLLNQAMMNMEQKLLEQGVLNSAIPRNQWSQMKKNVQNYISSVRKTMSHGVPPSVEILKELGDLRILPEDHEKLTKQAEKLKAYSFDEYNEKKQANMKKQEQVLEKQKKLDEKIALLGKKVKNAGYSSDRYRFVSN